jgi:hypothetical protein
MGAGYSDEQLSRIFDKTGGYCSIAGCEIVFSHYGRRDVRTGWEVDHRVALACGGGDSPSNLWPACWKCNVDKGAPCLGSDPASDDEQFDDEEYDDEDYDDEDYDDQGQEADTCAARLGYDGRRRCTNRARPGSKYCGTNRGWRGGSF